MLDLFFLSYPDYVDEIYNTYMDAFKANELPQELVNLNAMKPKPMNTILEKQNTAEAISKKEERRVLAQAARDVPPTTPCKFFFACFKHEMK